MAATTISVTPIINGTRAICFQKSTSASIEAEVDFWKHIALVPFIIGVTLIVVAAIAIFILLNSNLKKHSKKVAPPEKLVLERRKNIGSKKKRKKNK